MSPASGIAASQLRQLIFYHLDNDMVDNANFLAQRLFAAEPRNPDSSHLLALTYFRLRRFRAAFDFSQKYGANGRHLGCAYIFAQSCLELEQNMEGVTALEKSKSAWAGKNDWKQHSGSSRRHIPDAAAVLTLLAKLWRAHGDFNKAGDYYIEAHKLNPFVWDAFEGLCKIGADLKVENMFKSTADMPGAAEAGSGETQIYVDEDSRQPLSHVNLGPHAQNVLTTMDDPFTSSITGGLEEQDLLNPRVRSRPALGLALKQGRSDWDTPTTVGGLNDDDVAMGGISAENDDTFHEMAAPAAPSRRERKGPYDMSDRPKQPPIRGQSASEGISDDALQAAPRKPTLGGQKRNISGATSQPAVDSSQPRRSNRLFTQTTASSKTTRSTMDTAASIAGRADRPARQAKPATGTRGRTGAVVGRVVSGNRKVLPPDEKEKEKRAGTRNNEKIPSVPSVTSAILQKSQPGRPSQSDILAEQHAMSALLDNFRNLAVAYNASSKFSLPDAIAVFRALPATQRETPWVLAQLGKAHYEAGDYRASEECFARLLKLVPSRVDDMEIYSTVLWHLKKESTLTFLCRSLQDSHFDAPQTWVAVGNAFSLAREHDQAIAAFKRATQIDPKFGYTWTLMGHEHIANEAYDSALASFRHSVSVDRRAYSGWYGLGKAYQCMGKLEDAEKHYRIASNINPSNSTLLVCIGVVLERLRNKKGALANYTKALELAPDSALARFKKARVLMHMKYYDDALGELEILKNQAPDEANVHFLLGKCFKGLGERGEALRAFTEALNLDTKAAPFIKEAMEALDEEDEESDDD
ncbi:related to 20S cyclosome subunit (BimA/Nuc2/Cdc27) [Ramularia collo-cygni]|uniref:Related to 20S cyclosome subunit (BimA/Nuc2/Cdc27) n=1 Tax=Ramularia collo-cygni TaxID=112498 RepID=A0A2D3UNJ5_9PEZI|nr:related to 20S cyclosome subunit (BimA/Nuc2/Cdc27) [Ramularia collo-cygni]CZT15028.1 related to 20S cyclosome subunit (BimA/Nuc2/Cdc27) [Ramularia collo-cygni]